METSPERDGSSRDDHGGADGCRLEIDLDALAHNHAALQSLASGCDLAPVLKADAYGLGAEETGRALYDLGARAVFVARAAEGERLRAALPAALRIYVLDGAPAGSAARLQAARLTPVLNSLEQIGVWQAAGGALEDAALHVDTGMNRLGLTLREAEGLAGDGDTPGLLISHLACAGTPGDPMNLAQLRRFEAARALFPNAPSSLCNTEGLYLGPAFHHDVVRPGLGLFGGGPGAARGELRSVARLEAPILQVRKVPAGERIGYEGRFTAPQDLEVAIVAAGYADGVLRPQASGGYGWAFGGPRPYLGRISMDLLALDVTGCLEARAGAWVELLGPNVPLARVAAFSGLTEYEALARSDRRRRTWSRARA